MKYSIPQDNLIEMLKESLVADDLESFYSLFDKNFDKSYSSRGEGFAYSNKKKLIPSLGEVNINDTGLVGVDLPSLFSNNNGNGTVMVLAQDPLRNRKDFKNDKDIIIGTPFALHSSLYRKNGLGKFYYDLTLSLGEKFKEVYFTDVYKVWLESVNAKNMIYSSSIEILKKEIEILNPSAILALGNIAKTALKNIGIDETIIKSTPHPSARNPSWKQFGINTFDLKTKLDKILQTVNN